jgi:hypothetical protein
VTPPVAGRDGCREGWLQGGMAAGRDGCREHSCAHGRASRPPREGRRSLRLKQHRAAPAAVPQCESIERGAQQREEDVAYERARRDVGRHQAVGERCVNCVPERIARGSASHRACDGDLTRWTHRRGNAHTKPHAGNAHTKPHAVSHCEESQERGASEAFQSSVYANLTRRRRCGASKKASSAGSPELGPTASESSKSAMSVSTSMYVPTM